MKNHRYFRLLSLIAVILILATATHGSGAKTLAASSAFTFASLGDSQAEAIFENTVNQVASLDPALVIHNGDFEDSGVVVDQMDPMVGFLKNAGLYDRTFIVRGNHDDIVSGSAALWESYFETAPNLKTLPSGVTEYTPFDSSSTYLTYSFIYENAMFIGLDVPGDADLLTQNQLDWLNARLTYAEGLGLMHAFIYFHGPMYCVEEYHCTCKERTDGSCTPAGLVTVINAHPIISAFFHGHEHVLGWTHMDNTRLSGLTGSFEQFISSPAGGVNYGYAVFRDRMDYYYDHPGDPKGYVTQGFSTVSVNGPAFTYSLYMTGTTTPIWSRTFIKEPVAPVAPEVTTQAVTDIMPTTATGNGSITSLGLPYPTEHGVVWSTSANPTTNDSKTTEGKVSAAGAFTSAITGLTPGTLYHVRAYATNTEGTAYGEDVVFTTPWLLPTVTTQAVTDIAMMTAAGNGSITSLGLPNPTEHGVVWSTSANPTIADSKTTDGAVSSAGAFISNMTGLTPGMLYHVRAYATNAAGTAYGEDVTFTTLWLGPAVTTQAVTNITTTTATGNGNITVLGIPAPTQHGVVWSTTANPTIDLNTKTTDGAVSAAEAFTSPITGLAPGTLYHVRAYATNAAGTAYGEDVTFTTQIAPEITTQAATNIAATTAAGNGNITVLGVPNPTEHGVVWSTSANPTIALPTKTTAGAVGATGAFTSSITGLTPGTLYHVRAYAVNAVGIVYGSDVTFTTLVLPAVTTQPVTAVTTTTAAGHGDITGLGVPAPTQHGVVWSTSANPTIADSKTTEGKVSAAHAFTSIMTGLTPGTLYHVRAYATNTAGTVYGEDVTFTTLSVTSITVDCGSGRPVVSAGKSITCIATVTGGSGFAPTGSVSWTSSYLGRFAPSSCTLSSAEGSTATCSVIYIPTEVGKGSHLITASHAGDAVFAPGSGSQAVTVSNYLLFVPVVARP